MTRGELLVVVIALMCCGSPAPAVPPEQNPKVVYMSSRSSQPVIAITATNLIPWSRLPSVRVVDVGRPVGGAFEVPGPQMRPVRPRLEIATSPAGLAARVVQGDGVVGSIAVRDGAVIALPGPPLAVAARSDGLWALYREGLIDHDHRGGVRHRVALSGITLIGDARDAVWLVSSDQAWKVESTGAIHGPFPWRDPFTSFTVGGKLCARDRGEARALVCVSPDGTRSSAAVAGQLAPLEHPAVLEADQVITRQGTIVRIRRGIELVAEWTLQVVGVDADGAGFVVTASADEVALWRPAVGTSATIARRFPTSGPGSIASAAVAGDTVTLYGRASATTYRGVAQPADHISIDDAAYRDTIFPSAWEMSPIHGVAVRGDGSIVVAGSGPAGAALIELRASAR